MHRGTGRGGTGHRRSRPQGNRDLALRAAEAAEGEDVSWTKLADEFDDHPKIVSLSPVAELVQVRALIYANRFRTDGHVPAGAMSKLLRGSERLRLDGRKISAEDVVQELLDAGVWEKNGGPGWLVHDFLDYQFSKAQLEAQSETKRESGRKGGLRSGQARGRSNERLAEPQQRPSTVLPVWLPGAQAKVKQA